ncbi:MAG: hypothetical protein DRJ01_16155 [Bacteroidetes bacterium]|nr:MAG: hypothetical protein DRJ01_16155 [Bacteroidota bacterium]
MKNKKILSILFTLLISYGYAQENWSFYNSTNTPTIGPIDNAVIDITTDTAENLWFATINGLSKYDGTKWESFLYSNDYYGADYNKIIIDKENTIWLSSPFEFGNFYRIKNNKYEEICEGKHIYDMALDTSGHIWLATLHGLLEYTDDKFIDYSDEHELLDELSSISFDKNNKLCVGTFQNGILYKKDTCWINISEADGLISNEVNDIDFDNENNLWVATNSGVSCYSSEGITNYTSQDGLCSNSIEKVYVDNENFIWFSSQDSGCCYFNGNNFIVYNTQTGLKDNFIRSIFKDKKKGVWIAYYDEGVDYLINDKIINYSGNGINHIDCLFEDQNNNIWVGTRQGGINVFDGTNWKNYNFSNGFINNTIYCITSDNQQNIWISVPDGLAKYDGNKFEYITKEDGLPGKYNLTMYFDNKNNLWLGTAKKGVFKFDGKKWTAYNKTNSLIRERVEAICQDDDGNMWFGAADSSSMWDGVICKFDGNNWYSYHPIQGYASSILNDSEGNLWFGLRASMFKDTSILKYDGVNWEPILLNLDEPYTD